MPLNPHFLLSRSLWSLFSPNGERGDPDLTIHVGLPKTATTTLQSFFAQNLRGYVGPGAFPFHRVRRAFVMEDPTWWYSKDSLDLRRRFVRRTSRERLRSSNGDLVLSWEGALTAHMFMGEEPSRLCGGGQLWFDHLEAFIRSTLKPKGMIRWLVTVRRQPEWLASLYAQKSIRIEGADQSDFEEQVKFLLTTQRDIYPLNYEETVLELLGRFPGSEALVLPVEDFGTRHYRTAMSNFISHDLLALAWPEGRLNQRSIGSNEWQLRDWNPRLQGVHDMSYRVARLGLTPHSHRDKNQQISRKIGLSKSLTSEILARFGSSNAELQRYSPVPLSGYYSATG